MRRVNKELDRSRLPVHFKVGELAIAMTADAPRPWEALTERSAVGWCVMAALFMPTGPDRPAEAGKGEVRREIAGRATG